MKPFWNEMRDSGLSVVAIDEASGNLIGASISWDGATADNFGFCWLCHFVCCVLPTTSRNLDPMTELGMMLPKAKMGDIVKEFDKTESDLGVRVELLCLAVEPSFGGRGIGTKLVGHAYDLMKSKGFKFCYAECSSHYSEKAIVKMGGVIEHV